jgi:hypothetical protein
MEELFLFSILVVSVVQLISMLNLTSKVYEINIYEYYY